MFWVELEYTESNEPKDMFYGVWPTKFVVFN